MAAHKWVWIWWTAAAAAATARLSWRSGHTMCTQSGNGNASDAPPTTPSTSSKHARSSKHSRDNVGGGISVAIMCGESAEERRFWLMTSKNKVTCETSGGALNCFYFFEASNEDLNFRVGLFLLSNDCVSPSLRSSTITVSIHHAALTGWPGVWFHAWL